MTFPPGASRVVDLHLHTTASDGRCSPRELVDRAADAGLTVMAATDHDTTAAVAEVKAAAAERGIDAIAGVEITAVDRARDVHVLAYFLDPAAPSLVTFLAGQRAARVARLEAIGLRLAELEMPIDLGALMERARTPGRAIGRPEIARALVAAGYVADTREAFDQWLGSGRPAFIARTGSSIEDVIAIIHAAGGLASLAHPGRSRIDDRIPALCDAGLDAIEVFHPDHDAAAVVRYRQLALDRALLMTGGSDFHGDPEHGPLPGRATLPPGEWERLHAARHRHGDGK